MGATQIRKQPVPYWDQLKNLSNNDKLTLITMLSESMVEPKEETFEEHQDS